MLGLAAIGEVTIGQIATGGAAEFIGPDKYMPQFAEPVRFLHGLKASAQPFFAMYSEPVVSFGWFEPMSEPVRHLPRSPAAMAPFSFMQPAPSPFVATGWYEPLSEPVRFKPGLRPAAMPFIAYQDEPKTVTPFAWFAGLSEPVRFKRGLRPGQQQFFTSDTTVIPVTTALSGWYTALGEPVRYKVGLAPELQQFYAAPPRVLPTANLTGILDALETKDTMLAGAMVFNRPTDAEIGVINTTPQPAEVGLFPAATAAGVITVRISIIIG